MTLSLPGGAHSCTDSHVHTLTPSPEPASLRGTHSITQAMPISTHISHKHSHTMATCSPQPHSTQHRANAQATKSHTCSLSYTLVTGSHPHIATPSWRPTLPMDPLGLRLMVRALLWEWECPIHSFPAEPLSWLYSPGHPLSAHCFHSSGFAESPHP